MTNKIKTIDTIQGNTITYKNADDFIKKIRNDLNIFYYEYPDHELEKITIYNDNKNYYRLILLLDDCDVEEHIEYIVHKNNIKKVITSIKQNIGVTIRNRTKDL